jgi:hypothetical protein
MNGIGLAIGIAAFIALVLAVLLISFSPLGIPLRAWWFLRIARNAIIPPDVGRYLITLRDRNQLALDEIERKRRAIIERGSADGKTISTEAALKYLLQRKATYDGPDREQYFAKLDQFIDEFRKKNGPQIPVAQAYTILNELEAKFGRVEKV